MASFLVNPRWERVDTGRFNTRSDWEKNHVAEGLNSLVEGIAAYRKKKQTDASNASNASQLDSQTESLEAQLKSLETQKAAAEAELAQLGG